MTDQIRDDLTPITDLNQYRRDHPRKPQVIRHIGNRKIGGKIIRLFTDEDPTLTDEQIDSRIKSLDDIKGSTSGQKFNAIYTWLIQLGREADHRTELAATIRLAELLKSNPNASLTDIRTVIFEKPF